VLGPDWKAVELGFDVPFPGAMDQPWHRDFPSSPETYESRRITSLAFNLPAVDTTDEMGPVEIAHGTQWEPGLDFDQQMFPARENGPATNALPSASTHRWATSQPAPH
jgi:ectoine hydroxylase-related dioxygenase (phytanoyl-CoA dioxygenase family)